MAPKAIHYKTNSIIYFKGDASDKVYILNSGKVSLNYTDIETGQEIHELIKTGEFFGVKSALGRYPREETAVVLQDSTVIGFSVPEFEALANQNTRVIIKMLKVFSNQLRRIHKRVQNLLDSGELGKPETGLYKIGEYYLKNRQYTQALYAYKRYLVYYPSGTHAADVTRKIDLTQEYLQKYGQGCGPEQGAAPAADAGGGQPAPGGEAAAPSRGEPRPRQAGPSGRSEAADPADQAGAPPRPGAGPREPRPREPGSSAPPQEPSAVAKAYYNAVSLVSQQKYQEAFQQFQKLAAGGGDAEYSAKSQFEMGRCLYYLGQKDSCIRTFTQLVQKYPKHPELKEALYYVGLCYDDKGDKGRAAGFYNKILTMVGEEDPLYRKVRKALKAIGA